MRVSVVGLGPGPLAWNSSAAIDRLRTPGARVFVRTRFFPNLDQLLADSSWESFDELYETASSLDQVNRGIAERLLASGDHVVLGVPGDGTLGEAVLERLRDGRAEVEVVPGVPFGVAALAAAAQPAADGAQVVEATSLGGSGIDLLIELNPRWPAVITGVFSPRIAGDVKLALQRVYPAEHAICVVFHPGLGDQRVEYAPLADLDRMRMELDHLTHVVVPPVVGYVPTGSSHGLRAIVARRRAPKIGCPFFVTRPDIVPDAAANPLSG